MTHNVILQPHGQLRLGDFLKQNLSDQKWEEFRAAIAFVKHSGMKHIQQALADFYKYAKVKITVGIDCGGTSVEGLTDLLQAIGSLGDIWVFHNENTSTFHPKIYLFKNKIAADILIGSGNLTEGGLYTNYEAGIRLILDRSNYEDCSLLASIEDALDMWSQPKDGLCYQLDSELLKQLIDHNYVPTEAESWEAEEKSRKTTIKTSKKSALFKRIAVPKAPTVSHKLYELPKEPQQDSQEIISNIPQIAPVKTSQSRVFLMTLQKTDVGIGQTTQGTSRRSPEIFIPLAARNADPEFWGWPTYFNPDPLKPGKMDRFGVKMRIGLNIFDVNMMTWPDKHDFRLRSEHLRSAGNIGDILYMERSDDASSFSYYVEVIPQGSVRYEQYLNQCVNSVRHSKRFWGYI